MESKYLQTLHFLDDKYLAKLIVNLITVATLP